jgi:hypothetical protein
MKGVIVMCLQDLVTSSAGQKVWKQILAEALDDEFAMFVAGADVDDEKVTALLASTMSVLNMTLSEAADAFGEHWVNRFARKMYGAYFERSKSAREFLLRMDEVHRATTERMDGATPPRFTYEWKDDNTLIMGYESRRGLIDLMVGLIKGVGTCYGEKLEVTKLSDTAVQIVFA